MSVVTVKNGRYTVNKLYQWDTNQTLEIRGLSLPSAPEIHYKNQTMDRAIVRQATMDNSGVITANVPNSLLQKPCKITAYVCVYNGDTFESLYELEIPIEARKKPLDYTFEDDSGEIYSFNALENLVLNSVRYVDALADNFEVTVEKAKKSAVKTLEATGASIIDECNTIKSNLSKETSDALNAHLATFEIIRGTLTAGATEVTITDERITADCGLTVYTGVWGINPSAVTVANGSVTLTFYAQSADMEVGVQING